MIDAAQLRDWVVKPTLQDLGLWSLAAEQLVMGTAAQESHLGTYLVQIHGPARGIYQMEPATHSDIISNWLTARPQLWSRLLDTARVSTPAPVNLVINLAYATALCRLHYRRRPEPLPDASDIHALASYWKQHYNTPHGAGTEREFIDNWARYLGDLYSG